MFLSKGIYHDGQFQFFGSHFLQQRKIPQDHQFLFRKHSFKRLTFFVSTLLLIFTYFSINSCLSKSPAPPRQHWWAFSTSGSGTPGPCTTHYNSQGRSLSPIKQLLHFWRLERRHAKCRVTSSVQIPDEGLSQTSKGPVSKVLSSLEGEAGPGPCGRCFTQKGWVFMSFSPTAPPLRPQRQHMLYVTCMGDPMEAGASWCYCGLLPHKAGRTRLRGH